MRTEPEGELVPGPPIGIEAVGVVEKCRVPVGRRNGKEHLGFGRNGDAAESRSRQAESGQERDRRLPAEEFFARQT